MENLRNRRVLGRVAVCAGLSLATLSFCAAIASANSAPADDPFLPWIPDAGLFSPAPDAGVGSMMPAPPAPDAPPADLDVAVPDPDLQADS